MLIIIIDHLFNQAPPLYMVVRLTNYKDFRTRKAKTNPFSLY